MLSANLHVISWVLEKSMTVLIVALPIVFQPELRRALEQIGRGRLFRKHGELDEYEVDEMVNFSASTASLTSTKWTKWLTPSLRPPL